MAEGDTKVEHNGQPASTTLESGVVENTSSNNTANYTELREFCDDYAKYLEFPDLTKKQVLCVVCV